MDTIIGFKTNNFTISAYEQTYNNQIFRLDKETKKHFKIDEHKLLLIGGKKCDADVFGSFIQRNIQFLLYKNGYVPTLDEVANFVRTKLAEALRKGAYEISVVLVGYDDINGPGCYFLDYTGVLSKVRYTAQGYAQYFLLGLLNDETIENLSENEAIEILRKCMHSLKQRFMVQHENWVIQLVDKNGIRMIK